MSHNFWLILITSIFAVNSEWSRDMLKMNYDQVAVICNHVSLFIMIHFMITASLSASLGSFWYPHDVKETTCDPWMEIHFGNSKGFPKWA